MDRREVLPPLTPIEGVALGDPLDLLSVEEQERLKADLARMAKQRRDAEVFARDWPLP